MEKLPDRIGKYEVIRLLGSGGMGIVYLARDPDLDRLLAIKILRDEYEDELIQRFLLEARSAGKLRHDNIITVHDAGKHNQRPFMAMEYVDGVTLAEIIRMRQPLALADKLWYLEQICAGLSYAHSHDIVHRDIKPANVMVDRRHVVRIVDFGIARVEGSGITRDGASMIGTLNYMSPEQMLGRPVDKRSDIFAFGAVAYELITYERAFPGGLDDGLLHRLPHEPPRQLGELCPGLPEALESVIMRALAKLPHDRFEDLDHARLALRQIRRQLDPQLEVEPTAASNSRSRRSPATPTPASQSAERREFLERRSRQLASHRDAARTALRAHDLDAATAACEDALMLDPDDVEALQLLAQIDEARQHHGLVSKERHERDRTVRRHIADADVKLSKGDAATAAKLLRQALTLDPENEAARTLLSRIEQPSPSNVAVDQTVLRPKTRTRPAFTGQQVERAEGVAVLGPDAVTRSASDNATPAGRSKSSWPLWLAAAVVLAAVGLVSILLWNGSNETAPAATPAIADNTAPANPVGDRTPVTGTSTPVGTKPAAVGTNEPPDATGKSTNVTPAPSAVSPAEGGTSTSRAPASPPRDTGPSPDVAPEGRAGVRTSRSEAVPPEPPTAPPTSDPVSPVPVVVPVDLEPIEQALAARNLQQALSLLEGLPNQTDERIRSVARRLADRSRDDMAAAESEARVLKADELARTQFAEAFGAKTRSDRALERVDYPQAARQALAAANDFSRAADEARRVYEAQKKPQAPPTPKAPAVDLAGILNALTRFQAAYVKRDVDAIRSVFASYPQREFKRRFSDCKELNLTYSGIVPAVADDGTTAMVTLRSTYYCQPRINAPRQEIAQEDFFRLRKFGDIWLIERSGALDALQ